MSLPNRIFSQNKCNAANLLITKMQEMLRRVDEGNIRGTCKIHIYDRYVIQCMFLVSVREISSDKSAQLEALSTKYLKKWLEGKSLRCLCVDFLYYPEGPALKPLDQICKVSRAGLVFDS